MNLFVTKISGTVIFSGMGYESIHQPKNDSPYNERYQEFLLNEEFKPSDVYTLPSGHLVIHTLDGDEQPSSEMYILKDYKIELVELEIREHSFRQLHSEFRSGLPEKLRNLLNHGI